MTQDININWGMLSKPWGNTAAFFLSEELPSQLILEEGWVPLKATFYEDGQVEAGMSATVKKTDLKQEMVTIASDIKVKSLSQYLFMKMRQQQ